MGKETWVELVGRVLSQKLPSLCYECVPVVVYACEVSPVGLPFFRACERGMLCAGRGPPEGYYYFIRIPVVSLRISHRAYAEDDRKFSKRNSAKSFCACLLKTSPFEVSRVGPARWLSKRCGSLK